MGQWGFRPLDKPKIPTQRLVLIHKNTKSVVGTHATFRCTSDRSLLLVRSNRPPVGDMSRSLTGHCCKSVDMEHADDTVSWLASSEDGSSDKELANSAALEKQQFVEMIRHIALKGELPVVVLDAMDPMWDMDGAFVAYTNQNVKSWSRWDCLCISNSTPCWRDCCIWTNPKRLRHDPRRPGVGSPSRKTSMNSSATHPS